PAARVQAKTPAKATSGPADGDNIQQGDQGTPDVPGSRDTSSEQSGETGSEVPGNDGPNGHADEPGNPNADHQFQGSE
ncbi:MAG TPA: hypothetical protein VN971_05870, partial [Thermoanaerobaculia bacterium]|nr:hypothetical protein [Thermoanaerobaculia bacterium]